MKYLRTMSPLIILITFLVTGCTLHQSVPIVNIEKLPSMTDVNRAPLHVEIYIKNEDETFKYLHNMGDGLSIMYTFPSGQLVKKLSPAVFSQFFDSVEVVTGGQHSVKADLAIIPVVRDMSYKEKIGLTSGDHFFESSVEITLMDNNGITLWKERFKSPNIKKTKTGVLAHSKAIGLNELGELVSESIASAIGEAAKEAYKIVVQPEYAIGNIRKMISADPVNPILYLTLSSLNIKNKQYDEAITAAKRAIELKPDNAGAYNNLGHAYRMKKQYNEALSAFKKVIDLDPANVDCRVMMGSLLLDRGDSAGAIEAYKKAVELQPNNIKPLLNLAKAYRLMGKYDDALVPVSKAIEMQTKEKITAKSAGESFGLRSLIYRHKGNKEGSFRDAEKAYSLDAADEVARLSLGTAYLDRGQYDEAIKLLSHVKDSAPARILEATAYARQKDFKKASAIYNAITEDDEYFSTSVPRREDQKALFVEFKPLIAEHRKKAKENEAKGDYRNALAELSKAIMVSGDSDSKELRGEILRLVRRMPSTPEIPEEARKHALRGEAMIKDGEFENAAKEFRTAIKIAPYVAKLYFNTALLYADMKKYPEAIRHMKTYTEMAPEAPDVRTAKDEMIKWEYLMEKKK